MPAESLQRALLRYFDREQRDLPWREDRDPYRIWISEVMLQQTQVKTVIPYYRAFLASFPSLPGLAAAEIEEVLASWSGLGYYRRARQLHAAAQILVTLPELPRTAAEWQKLPGIGPYTAAAITSQAFGEKVPVLDGNVERVLCRRLALEEDPKRREIRARLLSAAGELLDELRPGDANQALMELGATLCRPRQPLCLLCPLAEGCAGRATPERYPKTAAPRQSEKLELVVALVVQAGKALFFRRPADAAFLPGLFELPNVERAESHEAIEARLAEIYGGRFHLGAQKARFKHAITYRRLEIGVHEATWEEGSSPRELRWADEIERGRLGLSSMFEKALKGPTRKRVSS